MKKLVLTLLYVVIAMSAMAQRRVLTNFSDSLSYCSSFTIGEAMVEAEKELTPQMIKETIEAFDEATPNPAFINMEAPDKSYAMGCLQGVFLGDAITHSSKFPFDLEEMSKGLRAGAYNDFSRMDTIQCKQYLEDLTQLPDSIDNIPLKRNASFAFGMLKAYPGPAALKDFFETSGGITDEPDRTQYALGMADTLLGMVKPHLSLLKSVYQGMCDKVKSFKVPVEINVELFKLGFNDGALHCPEALVTSEIAAGFLEKCESLLNDGAEVIEQTDSESND